MMTMKIEPDRKRIPLSHTREQRMRAGAAVLSNWLADMASNGLLDLAENTREKLDTISTRMVDAQMGGIARRLRLAEASIGSSQDWPFELTCSFGELAFVAGKMPEIESLSVELQNELLQFAGVNVNKEAVLSSPGIEDHFLIGAIREREEERLRVRETYLIAKSGGAGFTVIDFAFGNRKFVTEWEFGDVLAATVCRYPGLPPYRAIVRKSESLGKRRLVPQGYFDLPTMADMLAGVVANNPVASDIPVILHRMQIHFDGPGISLIDPENRLLSVHLSEGQKWPLIALGAGNELSYFGIMRQQLFHPFAVWTKDRFIDLGKFD